MSIIEANKIYFFGGGCGTLKNVMYNKETLCFFKHEYVETLFQWETVETVLKENKTQTEFLSLDTVLSIVASMLMDLCKCRS